MGTDALGFFQGIRLSYEDSRFEEILISEDNVNGIIELVKNNEWVGLVDDKTGGIIAVGKPDIIATIVRVLNLLNSK